MKFNYFIEEQLISLNDDYKTLTTPQRISGASFFNRVLEPAHSRYSASIKSTSGFFKSHIPCTQEYQLRSDCAAALETARETMRTLKGY